MSQRKKYTPQNGEFTGPIMRFFDNRKTVKVGNMEFPLSDALWANVTAHFHVNDFVKVGLRDGQAVNFVKWEGTYVKV